MNKKHIFHLAVPLIIGLLLAFASVFLISRSVGDAQAAYAPGSAPAVTSLSPTSAANDLSVQITITGAGFVAPPAVE